MLLKMCLKAVAQKQSNLIKGEERQRVDGFVKIDLLNLEGLDNVLGSLLRGGDLDASLYTEMDQLWWLTGWTG